MLGPNSGKQNKITLDLRGVWYAVGDLKLPTLPLEQTVRRFNSRERATIKRSSVKLLRFVSRRQCWPQNERQKLKDKKDN